MKLQTSFALIAVGIAFFSIAVTMLVAHSKPDMFSNTSTLWASVLIGLSGVATIGVGSYYYNTDSQSPTKKLKVLPIASPEPNVFENRDTSMDSEIVKKSMALRAQSRHVSRPTQPVNTGYIFDLNTMKPYSTGYTQTSEIATLGF
jgi:hypothetical protein